ncbi:MAG: D-glycero-beta-D-manno-heptose-7-phosphate kinase [Pseudomonadota bacterium]
MTEKADFSALIEGWSRSRLLIVGDLMLDRFIYGAVSRISPEGPIPVLRADRDVPMLGGAGNVLRNALALGAKASLITVIGDDNAGQNLLSLTGEESTIIIEKGRLTTQKDRFVAQGQQLLRCDREDPRPIQPETGEKILAAAADQLDEASILVLSDYGKGVLGGPLVSSLIALAKQKNCGVFVDPKGEDFGRYRGASLVTPNLAELRQTTKFSCGEDWEVEEACRQLSQQNGINGILATRSEKGMTLLSPKEEGSEKSCVHLRASAQEVFDVSGAGDTVVATFATAVAAGSPWHDAARLANTAAGIVVGKVGTAVVHPKELLQALHSHDLLASEEKLQDLDTLLERVAIWRARGLKVGFTNGCFDLLHPGHISLLTQARKACDRLIVGLNSDVSVTRLKGPDRPIQSEAARANVLSSLEVVNCVAVFSEDTPFSLIEAIQPDVLVKGADYRLDQVVGADLVQSYGGKVVLAELKDGHSTTGTIKRLSN